MIILTKIWNYFSTPQGQRNFLFALLVIFALIYFRGCHSTPAFDESSQNLEALKDTVTHYKEKNGQLVFEKTAFVTTQEGLKSLNKQLADQVEDLKLHPITVTKVVVKVVTDTVQVVVTTGKPYWGNNHTSEYIPANWNLDTTYSPGNYRNLSGSYVFEIDSNIHFKSHRFSIDHDEMGISFTTGIVEDRGKARIVVTSAYPKFKADSIQGALFDPTKSEIIKKFFPPKRWSFGPYIGYGAYLDFKNARAGTAFNAGFSVNYSIFQWNFKK